MPFVVKNMTAEFYTATAFLGQQRLLLNHAKPELVTLFLAEKRLSNSEIACHPAE